MKKVGFSAGCPDGDISSLSNQLKKFKELGVDSLEIQIFSMDVIMGKKINQPELKILKDTLLNQDFEYSVHGALSVNLLNQEYFDSHKEMLKRNIEVSGEINATHLVTHFGLTTEKYKSGSGMALNF